MYWDAHCNCEVVFVLQSSLYFILCVGIECGNYYIHWKVFIWEWVWILHCITVYKIVNKYQVVYMYIGDMYKSEWGKYEYGIILQHRI